MKVINFMWELSVRLSDLWYILRHKRRKKEKGRNFLVEMMLDEISCSEIMTNDQMRLFFQERKTPNAFLFRKKKLSDESSKKRD